MNTPRQVTRATDNTQMWTWFSDPFGTTAANSNPAGAGTFKYNLRFPGQTYDSQAGLHQNWNRDYDPTIGRYVESDPIGLHAGVNTYAYVGTDPVDDADPTGLLRRGGGLTDQNWQTVQQAETRIRQELGKSCSCHAIGSAGSCIPCDILEPMLSRLDSSIVSIDPNLPSNVCGQANIWGYNVWLSSKSFTEKGCGCLAAVVYHELLHNSGLMHDGSPNDPDTLENKCIGNLCRRP